MAAGRSREKAATADSDWASRTGPRGLWKKGPDGALGFGGNMRPGPGRPPPGQRLCAIRRLVPASRAAAPAGHGPLFEQAAGREPPENR
jgi:hypothetical protein